MPSISTIVKPAPWLFGLASLAGAAALAGLQHDWRLAIVFVLAWSAEFINGAFGMGFGTLLTPALLWLGYSPVSIVSCILATESVTGIAAAFFHDRHRNIDFRQSKSRNTALLLSGACALGVCLGVPIALWLTKSELIALTGTIIVMSGIVLLVKLRRVSPYRHYRVFGLSILAAFNKSLSGGGFGPLLTSGQILGGIPPKSAAAITSITKSVTGMLGVVLYLSGGFTLDGKLLGAILIGSLLVIPLATGTVRGFDELRVKRSIGWLTIGLGFLTVLKAFFQ